uniref:ERL2 n=1 Tax=Arundo donax TaxID=35708 RepID=A0A0A9H9S4_ARUDO
MSKISKLVQFPMLSGIVPVRLFPLTSKYHRPVSWHMSGDKVPDRELPLKPRYCSTSFQ